MIWPIFFALIYTLGQLSVLTSIGLVLYLILILNGLILAVAFDIFVLSMAITTYEVDNTLTIYRDLSSLGRVPVDLYREPLRFFITFVLPVGIMITFPVKALIGLLNPLVIIISIVVTLVFFRLTIVFWDRALRSYSSASS